ncbi:MAG: MoaD/ThiS family protein [Betaproteobacteria bacterium]|nr:MoaD/ThiS family protein [Betaproteobacteria bacterium]
MSNVTIRIPTPLRSYTGGADEVRVQAQTLGEALHALGAAHDGVLSRVLDAAGEPRQFINIYIGGNNVRGLDGLASAVAEGEVISIVPAVAGGADESRRSRDRPA